MDVWTDGIEYERVKLYHDNDLYAFNKLPENCKPISAEKFGKYIAMGYHWVAEDYRQPRVKGYDELDGVKIDTARLFFFSDGSGFGAAVDFDGKVHYFEFKPCEHDFELVWARGFEKKYKCRKCGYEYYVDSSD